MRLASIQPPLAAALLSVAAATAFADDLRTLPVPTLQRMFLACERQAARGLMGLGDAAGCSHAYEALLARGFDGDFKRLLAWWQAERAGASADVPAQPQREARRTGH